MALVQKTVATGDKKNVAVLVEDLELLKTLKAKDDSSLAVTINRILNEYTKKP